MTRRLVLVPVGYEEIDVLLALRLGARLHVRVVHDLCSVTFHNALPQVSNVYYLLRLMARG